MPSAFSSAARAVQTFVRPGRVVVYTVAAVYVPTELVNQIVTRAAHLGGKPSAIALLVRAITFAAAGALTAPALLHLFERSREGALDGGQSARDALRFACEKFPRSLMYRTYAFVLTLGGTLLLVVPGIILLCMSALVDPAVALEPAGQNAWSRSRRLTRGMRSHTLAAGAVLGVICALALLPIFVAHNAVAGSAGDISAATTSSVNAIAAPDAARVALVVAAETFRQVFIQTATSLFTALAFELYNMAAAREGQGD